VETSFGTRLEYQYKYKKAQSTMWGGRMTENLAQSLARILIAEQMLKIDPKYSVATSTHDEVVCVVDSGRANSAYDEIVDIMTRPPTWAPDLPLAAEGGVSQYYDVK
jgi:DNA polymerase